MTRLIPPVLVVLAVVVAFRWLATYAAQRGWIYGRHNAPKRGNAVGGLGFEQVFQPSIEHVIEEQHRLQIEASQDQVGEGDE